MFWAETIPAALFFIMMWFVPDSPRWLLKKGYTSRAISILKKIGGSDYAENTKNEIEDSFKTERSKIKFASLFGKTRNRSSR